MLQILPFLKAGSSLEKLFNKKIFCTLCKKKNELLTQSSFVEIRKNEKNLKIHSSILIGYCFYDITLGFDRDAFQYAAAAVV